jgi:hypothetical protein
MYVKTSSVFCNNMNGGGFRAMKPEVGVRNSMSGRWESPYGSGTYDDVECI